MASKTKAKQLDLIITDASVITEITDQANWDVNGDYTWSTVGLVINQNYFDWTFFYTYNGTVLIRMKKLVYEGFGGLYHLFANEILTIPIGRILYTNSQPLTEWILVIDGILEGK